MITYKSTRPSSRHLVDFWVITRDTYIDIFPSFIKLYTENWIEYSLSGPTNNWMLDATLVEGGGARAALVG